MSHQDEISAPGSCSGRVRLSLGGKVSLIRPDAIVQVAERRKVPGSIIYLTTGEHINTSLHIGEVLEAIDLATDIGREQAARRAVRVGVR
jgi:hypothetical protein